MLPHCCGDFRSLALRDGLNSYEEMLAFERRYGVRSETFYAAYQSGEEPEDDTWVLDFGEWASVYRAWLARQSEYRNEIQRRQRSVPGLAGLIRVAA